MPRKRKDSRKRLGNQINIITTRLIQISMRLEEYVYQNKPISLAEAKAYIGEISMYKHHCHRDARSLQVIEKLTRCMNGIVKEQQRIKISNNTTSSIIPAANYTDGTWNQTSSPTYSLPDEDRTQFSEDTFNNQSEDIENAQVIETNVENAQVIETINLDDGDNIVSCSNKEIDTAVEIHRAISTLSIRNGDDSQNIATDECSQSILRNFEHDTNICKNADYIWDSEITKTSYQQLLVSHDETAPDNALNIKCVALVKSKTNIFSLPSKMEECNAIGHLIVVDKTTGNIPETKTKTAKKTKRNKIEKDKNIQDGINKPDQSNKTVSRKRNTNKVQKVKESKVVQRKKSKQQSNALKNQNSPPKMNFTNSKNDTRITEIVEDNDKYLMNSVMNTHNNNNNTDIVKDKEFFNKNIATTTALLSNSSTVQIYNKLVEDDLSWLENIRYVREIADDEYDSKLTDLENCFWDNFSLPNNWDDRDFSNV